MHSNDTGFKRSCIYGGRKLTQTKLAVRRPLIPEWQRFNTAIISSGIPDEQKTER